MADRGRDLKFSVLSDADRFDLDRPARDLEDLGEKAEKTGRVLNDELSRDARDAVRELAGLSDEAKRVDLEGTLGTDAKAAAKKVDSAFDTIARASRTTARKVDDDTDRVKGDFREVGNEAGSTAREAAASFSGSGDIGDALQELAANAPAALGPLGLAFGAVAGIGVGLFRAETEKIREDVKTLVDQIIADGGRLSEESILGKQQELAADGTLARLREMADALDLQGVRYGVLARAKAGDEEAMEQLNQALDENAEKYAAINDEAGNVNITNELMRARIKQVRDEFADQQKTIDLTKEAINDYREASINSGEAAKQASSKSIDAFDDLRSSSRNPIVQRVQLSGPSAAAVASFRAQLAQQMGEIVVPVRPGQTRYSNTADNSRYR